MVGLDSTTSFQSGHKVNPSFRTPPYLTAGQVFQTVEQGLRTYTDRQIDVKADIKPHHCSQKNGSDKKFCLVDSTRRVKHRCRVSESEIHSCIRRQIESLARICRISSKECQDFLTCLNRRVAAFPHRRSNQGRLQVKVPPLPP